jgi:stage IV sporulation protein B
MKKFLKILCWIITPILFITLTAFYEANNIPDTIFLRDGEVLHSNSLFSFNEINSSGLTSFKNFNLNFSKAVNSTSNQLDKKQIEINVFGIIPFKTVSVKTVPKNIKVYPGGQPIGVKLNTKGVLVIALCDIETTNGKIPCPASEAGILIGDSILKINNKDINNCEELSREISISEGKTLTLLINRKEEQFTKKIVPVKSISDNKYKIGLWVRDSTAGVGTLTFYDKKSGTFAALGHPITDVDTGTLLSINKGEIVKSSIVSIKRGVKGNPGELKGIFEDEDNSLGNIIKNTKCGIFGKANEKIINNFSKPLEIGLRGEIQKGHAQILTTIDSNGPKLYDIEILKLLNQDEPGPKSMVIKVTDTELLKRTGGIVQGMSGSPIIQNNKIIGAVTHVLVNKPDIGYGIYIEWMLKEVNLNQKN